MYCTIIATDNTTITIATCPHHRHSRCCTVIAAPPHHPFIVVVAPCHRCCSTFHRKMEKVRKKEKKNGGTYRCATHAGCSQLVMWRWSARVVVKAEAEASSLSHRPRSSSWKACVAMSSRHMGDRKGNERE